MLLCVCLVSVHEPVRSVAGGVMYVHVGAIEREGEGGDDNTGITCGTGAD